MEKILKEKLWQLYQNLPFTGSYGPDKIEYLCGLSVRYALAALPTVTQEEYHIISIWLSYTWIIDAIFDKMKVLVTKHDVNTLRSIFGFTHTEVQASKHEFINIFMKALTQLHQCYLTKMNSYRNESNNGWQLHNYWVERYLDTLLLVDDSTLTESTYRSNRLDTGAMMCIVGQALLLTRYQGVLDVNDELMVQVALAVSYYNDLLSMMRDCAQNTPNLVILQRRLYHLSLYQAFQKAYTVTQNLVTTIMETAGGDSRYAIATTITKGSIDWHMKEPRYAKGAEIIIARENEQLFAELTKELEYITPGDPN